MYDYVKCTQCGNHGTVDEGAVLCPQCSTETLIKANTKIPQLSYDYNHNLCVDISAISTEYAWINVYKITRHYGGPEEGGWYYNTAECIENFMVDLKDAEDRLEKAKNVYKPKSWGNIYSVNGGVEFDVFIEPTQAHSEDLEPPYYE